MPKLILLSAVVLSATFSLVACGPRKQTAATSPPATAGAPGANLWTIEVMNGDKAVSTTRICADDAIHAGFARPAPEVQGRPCIRGNEPVEKGATYAARCHVDGQLYGVGSTVTGDTTRDFTVDMAVKPLDKKGPTYEQVRRYRLVGTCPPGWNIGDSAAPGAQQLVNSLSGKARPMPSAGR